MSHFTVLTAVHIPEIGTCPEAQPSRTQLESMAEHAVDALLEPYNENPTDPAFLEFQDMTEECRKIYESGGLDCAILPNGTILPAFSHKFTDLYEIYEGRVYKRRFGPLHHRKRTKKAKRIKTAFFPFKRLYSTFKSFMEDYYGYTYNNTEGAYGYYCNPNAHWDWYLIGGRWPSRFLVKEDCETAVIGERSFMLKNCSEPKAPDGLRWAAGAMKRDINWEAMKNYDRENATRQFHLYVEWSTTGMIPEKYQGDYRFSEDGISSWGDTVYYKGESLEDCLRRLSLTDEFQYPIGTFAYASEAGWEGFGEMGWFGMSYNDKEQLVWARMVEEFIKALPDDTFLISVDCHI